MDKPATDSTGTTSTANTGSGQLESFDLSLSDVVSTVVWVEWTSDVPGSGWVEYGLDGLTLKTPVQASAGGHRIAVLGLKGGKSYNFQAITEADDGTRLTSDVVSITPLGPEDYPEITITAYEADRVRSADSFAVLSTHTADGGYVVMIDHDGDVVWFMRAPTDMTANTPKISYDGTALIWAEWDRTKQVDKGRIVRMSLDGETYDEVAAPFVHHTFIEHSDGTVAFLGIELRDLGSGEPTLSDQVLEVKFGSTDEPVQVFSFFDDYPAEVWLPCEHAVQSSKLYGLDDADEWTHANSMMYDPIADAYYVAVRFHDSLIKIDRTTGNVIWELGGAYSTFEKVDGTPIYLGAYLPQLWSHGHMSQLWDDGFMYYNNGNHDTPKVSTLQEFRMDQANQTVEEVWSFSDGRYQDFLSDVRRLDNGNLFVVGSPSGEVMELSSEGDLLWRAVIADTVFGRAEYLDNVYDLKSSLMHQ